MMARYGVACPFPQDEEIVSPKMVIFTRSSKQSGRCSSAGRKTGLEVTTTYLPLFEMHSAPSRWLGELDDVIRRGRIGAPGRSRTGDTSFAGSCLSHLATGAQ